MNILYYSSLLYMYLLFGWPCFIFSLYIPAIKPALLSYNITFRAHSVFYFFIKPIFFPVCRHSSGFIQLSDTLFLVCVTLILFTENCSHLLAIYLSLLYSSALFLRFSNLVPVTNSTTVSSLAILLGEISWVCTITY